MLFFLQESVVSVGRCVSVLSFIFLIKGKNFWFVFFEEIQWAFTRSPPGSRWDLLPRLHFQRCSAPSAAGPVPRRDPSTQG